MDDRIDKAITTIQRSGFLKRESDDNIEPEQPITIDQNKGGNDPSILRGMLNWLSVKPGQKILSVGTGTGAIAALLSMLVGDTGKIVAVEASPELLEQAQRNIQTQNLKNITLHRADEDLGWKKDAPYDRIFISSNIDIVPAELIDQLAPDGKLVVPVVDEVLEISKDDEDTLYRTPHGDFAFVPIMNCAD